MKLVFEIGCEELPAGEIDPALAFMASFMTNALADARIAHGAVTTCATPRRLTIEIDGLAESGETIEEEAVGPPARAAFTPDGALTKAGEGFARSRGVEPSALYRLDTPKGEYVAARVVHTGAATGDVLATALGALPAAIPWKRSMKWGWGTDTFARPVHWLLALLDSTVLPVEFAGISSGRSSRGHRFIAPDEFEIADAASYRDALKSAHVMVDIAEREGVIVDGVKSLCAEHGWTAIIDDGLLREVAHLVEWPFPMLGTFDEALLEVPREVLITSMKVHQRYFAVQRADTSLAPAFAFVCNAQVKIPEVVIAGNRRVLLARLEDARFFYREDKRRTLDERVEDLGRVVYMDKLGSIAERVARIESIAASLADTLHAGDAELRATVVRAAHLCKSDLVTGMVGEFPELQGIMGRYYALATAPPELAEVAEAIAEHYQPRGASDAVAPSAAGRVLALAEKLESIAGGFALGFAPTGSADPYALRRSAIGALRTIMEGGYSLSVAEAVALAWRSLPADVASKPKAEPAQIVTFLEGRLQSMLASQFPVDIVDAVVAVVGEDIPTAAARCDALNRLRAADGFEPLAAAYKRATNIVRKAHESGWQSEGASVDTARFEQSEETVLADALAAAAPVVAARTADKDFAGVANALIALKEPIDAFFDGVMVNAPDEAVRTNRLLLLEQTCQLFIGFADISRIQVTG